MRQDGIPFSYLGAKVSCPACRTTGFIVASGPRHHHSFPQGLQAALDGDLCRCGCSRMPILMASQDLACHSFGLEDLAIKGFNRRGEPCHMEDLDGACDERIRALDSLGKPIPNIAYYMETSSGKFYRGLTDHDGCCPRLHTKNPREVEIWFGLAAEMKLAGRQS